MAHEVGSSESERFALGVGVIGEGGSIVGFWGNGLEEFASTLLRFVGHPGWLGEACRACFGVHEIDVPVLDSEEPWATAHVGVADEHVRWDGGICGTAFVRDDGADGRVDGVTADHASGVDEVGGECVFVDDLVVD